MPVQGTCPEWPTAQKKTPDSHGRGSGVMSCGDRTPVQSAKIGLSRREETVMIGAGLPLHFAAFSSLLGLGFSGAMPVMLAQRFLAAMNHFASVRVNHFL